MVTRYDLNESELIDLPSELIKIVWGSKIDETIFERWSQAFQYSDVEKSALIQFEGGPCSVLTPVQAHLLNELIFSPRHQKNWRHVSNDEIDLHFLNALKSILHLLSQANDRIYLAQIPLEKQKLKLSPEEFHREIRFRLCQTNIQLKEQIFSRLSMWKHSYGILLFLYSCLMTKTINSLKTEIDDETSLPLIDIEHGHGSQSLTNLLITGVATPHCFDGEKDIAGLKLIGIRQQAYIGFLSKLEMYNLLEVGWFLKNPRNPIWILGSETHLTVFFSTEKSLVQPETQTPFKSALQIFHKYDTEKNGFVTSSLLDTLIDEMINGSLIKRTSSIADYKRRMDPDHLQIITKSAFIQEFFPHENQRNSSEEQNRILTGNQFAIYHYNGLPRSNQDNLVRYISGKASIQDYSFSNSSSSSTTTNNSQSIPTGSYLPITSVLRTKWSTIEVQWDNDMKPSLN